MKYDDKTRRHEDTEPNRNLVGRQWRPVFAQNSGETLLLSIEKSEYFPDLSHKDVFFALLTSTVEDACVYEL